MLTLNDGRSELWQWDTGRTLAVDADCSQVHFSNKVFGRSIDVDVADGVAIIPDILLQTDKDLNVWAFVGTAENGYTKISKTFRVNRRNKPADYVFTPVEQTTIAEIAAIAQSVRDDADAGLFNGEPGNDGITPHIGDNGNWYLGDTDTGKPSRGETGAGMDITGATVDQIAKITAVDDTGKPTAWEAVDMPSGGVLTTAEKTAMLTLFKAAAYTSDVSATIADLKTLWDSGGGDSGGDSGGGLSASYSNGNLTLDGVTAVYNSAALYLSGVSAAYNNGVLTLT